MERRGLQNSVEKRTFLARRVWPAASSLIHCVCRCAGFGKHWTECFNMFAFSAITCHVPCSPSGYKTGCMPIYNSLFVTPALSHIPHSWGVLTALCHPFVVVKWPSSKWSSAVSGFFLRYWLTCVEQRALEILLFWYSTLLGLLHAFFVGNVCENFCLLGPLVTSPTWSVHQAL